MAFQEKRQFPVSANSLGKKRYEIAFGNIKANRESSKEKVKKNTL
jgi:hypothetical protein